MGSEKTSFQPQPFLTPSLLLSFLKCKTVIANCGDVLICMYGEEEEEAAPEPEPEPVVEEAPPPKATQRRQPAPPPPAAATEAAPSSSSSSSSRSSGGGGGLGKVATLKGHSGSQVSCLGLSTTDPTLLASGGYDNKIVLWDIGAHQLNG